MTPPSALRFIAPGAFVVGACGIVAQVVLIRELLVTFQGNELVIGVILANWLLTEAAGAVAGERLARGKAPLAYYHQLLVFSAFAFPLAIVAGRGAGLLLGIPLGAAWGFAELFLVSLALLAPLSVPHGALFTLSCRLYPREGGTARVYVLETAGTVFGALVLTFLLFWQFNPLIITVYTALLLLTLAWLIAYSARWPLTRRATPIFLLAMTICGSWLGAVLDRYSLRLRFAGEVVFSQTSPHGNLTVTKVAGQTTFFYDGRFLASAPVPDMVLAEETAHFPLLAHPGPENVLLLAGGLGGVIPEILKHPVLRLNYAEVDPLIWRAGKQFIPSWEKLLHDERVYALQGDGRLLLQRGFGRFDVVLLGPLDPASLQLNRLFSRQFFELVRDSLNPGGIFAFSAPGSLVYPGPELLELNRVLYHTAQDVFAEVLLIPGDRNLFLALTDGAEGITVQCAVRRLTERGLQNKVVTPSYLEFRLGEQRLAWAEKLVEPEPALGQNTDFRPVAVYHVLAYWGAMFSPSVQAAFDFFKRLPFTLLLLVLPVLGAVMLLWPVRRAGLPGRALYATGSTGLAGMYAEIFLLLTLQVFYGYIYLKLSLLLSLFMAGTAAGGTLSHKWLERGAAPLTLLRKTETAVLLALLVLPLISFFPFHFLGSVWILIIFLTLSFLAGSLVGLTFPVAVQLQPAGRKGAGTVYAADLIGGWLGGLCAVLFFIPLLGLKGTAVAIMLVKAGSWLMLWRAAHPAARQAETEEPA